MAYINNTYKPNTSRFSRSFTPALTNIRSTPSKTPTASSKLNPGSLGMNTFNLSQPSQGWKDAFKGKPIPGTMGPIRPTTGLVTNKAPANQQTATPPVTSPQPEVGTTTTVGSVPATNQTNMIKQGGKTGLVKPPTSAFGGIVQGLQDRSKTSGDQRRLLKRLEQEAQANKSIGENARQISEDYGKEIAQVGKLGAGAVAGNLSTGSNVVGSGNANLASQAASARMSALSQGQEAALRGTGQQLSATGQLTNALTSGLGAQQAQQAAGIQGLSSAGQLAQPNPAAYGQTVFDPTTGEYTNNNMDPQQQAGNLAQQVMSGAMTYDQALASIGYAGAAGSNFLNNAITGAGGNPLQLQASGSAQQANITGSETAGTDIARAGLMDATQQYVQMNTAANTAHQQSQALLNIMSTADINGQPLIRVNKAWNQILEETSDPNIASYFAALEEARGFYSALLSTGGSAPTENDRKSIGILNGNSTPQATAAAIQELENAVARRLGSQYQAMQQYNQNLGDTGTGSYGGGGFAEAW